MKLIRGLNRWIDSTETVITIGNFDGVHRGHQAMLRATRDAADRLSKPATVVSFEPLPHEYFSAENSPPRLQGFRDRVMSMRDAGMDRLLLLAFDKSLASQTAEQFIREVLVATLHARHLIIGDDFKFGNNRSGNFDLLQAMADDCGYTLEQSRTCLHDGLRISSTSVRNYLLKGEIHETRALLGRPYRISGRVIHGEKVGRQLGYPTANVALGSHRPPLRGVFAVQATHLPTKRVFPAVANLGERPTLGGRKLLLEVHALDTQVDWYGHHLAIDFLAELRKERRFDSLDALKVQIGRDISQARQLISDL